MSPVRLERRKTMDEPKWMQMLESDLMFRLKFYILIVGAAILFLLFCFLVQPATYGFLWW